MKQLGYYLTEPIIRPPNCISPLNWLYTLADTIGKHHPVVDPFRRRNPKWADRYRAQLELSEAEFAEMYRVVDDLVARKLLAWDGRFAHLEDAMAFRDRFIKKKNVLILGFSVDEKFLEGLGKTDFFGDIPLGNLTDAITGKSIGWEILGWDGPRSASWIEDGLDELINMQHPLVITRWGFLAHKPQEVEGFAAKLKGVWTPEEYWPFEIHDCT